VTLYHVLQRMVEPPGAWISQAYLEDRAVAERFAKEIATSARPCLIVDALGTSYTTVRVEERPKP
jgi:hypothetical protein